MQKKKNNHRWAIIRMPLIWLVACLAGGGWLMSRGVSPAEQSPTFEAKPIEDVKAGDRVWAYNPSAGNWAAKSVLRPLVHDYAGDLVTVTVAGHTVEATGNHPFWVVAGERLSSRPEAKDVPLLERHPVGATGRWVDARHLEAGDVLVLRDGRAAGIEMVTVRRASLKVYNLQVADLHTYAVGDLGIAVHNKPCFPPGTLVLMGDGSTKAIEKIEVGDFVLARDPTSTAAPTPREVTCLFRDFADGLVNVTFQTPGGSSASITSTRFHPFWTRNRGWVDARDLSNADVLESDSGGPLTVTGVQFEHHAGKSFNLTVCELHTYFAVSGSRGILVHNQNPPVWLQHGTTATNSQSIIQNGFQQQQTFFAETGSEASYFAFAKTATNGGQPVRMLFEVPGDLAASLGLQRGVIGEATGMLPVDVANGTGYEHILPGSKVPEFNQAMKNGQVTVTERPAFRS